MLSRNGIVVFNPLTEVLFNFAEVLFPCQSIGTFWASKASQGELTLQKLYGKPELLFDADASLQNENGIRRSPGPFRWEFQAFL